MSLPKRWFVYAAVLLLAAVLVVAGLRLHRARLAAVANVAAPVPAPWALRTATVRRSSVERGFPVLATASAIREVTLTAQVAGRLLEMGPREGVKVRAGELLARIDTRELEEKHASLQAQLSSDRETLKSASAELEREQKLINDGASSARALETRRLVAARAFDKLRALERDIASLEVRIAYGRLIAPAAGVVAARLAEPGDIVPVNAALYRLTVDGGARVGVLLPQRILERVGPGTLLVLRHGDKERRVPLDRIYPALDSRALGVAEADLDAPPFGLPSGARISARVVLERRENALRVPRNAVLPAAGGRVGRVFKVIAAGDSRHLAEVSVGVDLDAGDSLAVRGALEAGDRVVVAHESVLLKLRDGDAVVTEASDPP